MTLTLNSPCKVNLLLNILRRRADGFHDLETLLQPIGLYDVISMEAAGTGIVLTCSEDSLPVDNTNLVYRAASAFLNTTEISKGVKIHLDKKLPMTAGLGGGSANAAVALSGLNQLFDQPLSASEITKLAASLGSDVPFFLKNQPALGTGRGERIQRLEPFRALEGKAMLLIRPGFGVSTAWAYQRLSGFPQAVNGREGKAAELIKRLNGSALKAVAVGLFNSLEVPVFEKYPLLPVLKEYLLGEGAVGALMSGSGSTMFAITHTVTEASVLQNKVLQQFGNCNWTKVVSL